MNAPSNLIRQHLIEAGLSPAAQAPWYCYVSFLPNDPDNALCVFDTPGRPDGRIMRTGEQIIHPGVQIMVRSKTYLEGWKKTRQIATKLDEVRQISIALESGVPYTLVNVSRQGDIFPLGMDEADDRRRYRFVINAMVTWR